MAARSLSASECFAIEVAKACLRIADRRPDQVVQDITFKRRRKDAPHKIEFVLRLAERDPVTVECSPSGEGLRGRHVSSDCTLTAVSGDRLEFRCEIDPLGIHAMPLTGPGCGNVHSIRNSRHYRQFQEELGRTFYDWDIWTQGEGYAAWRCNWVFGHSVLTGSCEKLIMKIQQFEVGLFN